MESKNTIFSTRAGNTEKEAKDPSRRSFLKKAILLGGAILTAPIIGSAEKHPLNEKKDHSKYEEFIVNQVNEITEIIETKAYNRILSNPYLAYCLHCLQSYLDKVADSKNQHDVPEKIIGKIAHLITPEFRAQAIMFLEEKTIEQERIKNKKISIKKVLPLDKFIFGGKGNHENAIDLFTDELSPVRSMASGLVLIAENGWKQNDESSTSSMLGGNTVVVFNYLTKEFFRYAHLNEVNVRAGDLVMEREVLRKVGHTGKNASRPGHGEHLHFEIHKYLTDQNTNDLYLVKDLRKILKNLNHF